METAPIASMEFYSNNNEDLLLACPKCGNEIPYIKPIFEEQQTYLYIQCFCSKDIIKLEMKEYFNKLREMNQRESQKCSKSNHNQKAVKFCLHCLKWMCHDCLDYHNEFASGHIFQSKQLNLICYKHQDTFILYCQDCQKSICKKCDQSHQKHKKEEIIQTLLFPKIPDIQRERENYIESINKLIDHLINLKEQINTMYDYNEKTINEFKEFYEILEATRKVIKKYPNYNYNKTISAFTMNTISQLKMDKDFINDCNTLMKKYPKIKYEKIDKPILQSFPNHNISSCQLNNDIYKLINSYITYYSHSQVSYQLIYSARENGDSADSFHSYCDNKGPTLTIITTTDGNVFGGYTSQSWEKTKNEKYKKDKEAFLFSLNFNKLYPISNCEYAILCNGSYGPIFGEGTSDLYIFDHCLSNDKSACNFPHSYKNGAEYEFNGYTRFFTVQELQIFQVLSCC